MLCLGVGNDYDASQLKRLTDSVFELVDFKLVEFFSWLGRSMAKISGTAPGDDVELPDNTDPNDPNQVVFKMSMKS